MDNTGPTALAAVMAIAVALHHDGVLPIERFIETLRRQALRLKAAGQETIADELLAMASQLATNRPTHNG